MKLRFTLAVDRPRQDQGADFVPRQVLNGRPRADGSTYAANLHEHMGKGKRIAISARLRIDSSRSELPSGEVRYPSYTSLLVQSVQFLDRKAAPTGAVAEEPAAEDQEVPFWTAAAPRGRRAGARSRPGARSGASGGEVPSMTASSRFYPHAVPVRVCDHDGSLREGTLLRHLLWHTAEVLVRQPEGTEIVLVDLSTLRPVAAQTPQRQEAPTTGKARTEGRRSATRRRAGRGAGRPSVAPAC